jgi:tRNA 2-selenouridine synthase
MTWRELSAATFNSTANKLVIDVRSPCEHEAERIPGSINVPLLSDNERKLVGIDYKQNGDLSARRFALTLISTKIPAFIDDVISVRQRGQTIVIYCWRGGLRSEAVSSVLSIAGLDCFRLTGGYKAWRAQVLHDFTHEALAFKPIVLHGLTGVGKTELLDKLTERGFQVLDLEALANHRGSVFGGLGLGAQPTQKNFDGLVWQRLYSFDRSRPVILEAESKRIGKLDLPTFVLQRIIGGTAVLVNGSLSVRASRISADYLSRQEYQQTEIESGLKLLDQLKQRLGIKTVTYIKDLVANGCLNEAILHLLTDYYDPLYQRQLETAGPFALELNTDNPTAAVEQFESWFKDNGMVSSAFNESINPSPNRARIAKQKPPKFEVLESPI